MQSPRRAKPAASPTLNGVAAISSIDALIALQGVEAASTDREKRLSYGSTMLDLLDDIRLGVLSGRLPTAKLEDLVRAVEERPDADLDPRLEVVLDEIELRARVELAKLGR